MHTPTTALRDPGNYGLRGWISASHDLAPGTPSRCTFRLLAGADRTSIAPVTADAIGTVLREHERHEAVEGPDGPLVAGLGDCLWRGRCESGGIRRTGSAGAVGIQAAGI